MEKTPCRIRATANGPYVVEGVERFENHLGEAIPAEPHMALCRCGGSANKPFCDGTHARNGFTDAKDPKRVPDRRDAYEGEQVTVLDNRGLCQHSGLCTDRLKTVFHSDSEPFVTPSGGRMDEIVRAVRDCPSGALSFSIDGREAREQVDWGGVREATIVVTKDGPYRVAGGIALVDDGGVSVARNAGASEEHYALCRCGQSQNKPFCSGMHWYVRFSDPAASDEPTLFEWAGGYPALLRTTRRFYEVYVPEDPLLAPLFAEMSPDHPERVASWLGEVFGGPKMYSEQFGGYARMISQHLGKALTEEKRARWVSLLGRSADESGLPSDPEFRAAFAAYVEWGTRLALENSQPGATPPPNMPMPRWWWVCDATPGSRISAFAPPEAEDQVAVLELPAAGVAPSFERHVKGLFRQMDRQSMRFAFDLWAYPDVKTHAHDILERVRNGSMPCDGAWPAERVELFARWVDAGTPP